MTCEVAEAFPTWLSFKWLWSRAKTSYYNWQKQTLILLDTDYPIVHLFLRGKLALGRVGAGARMAVRFLSSQKQWISNFWIYCMMKGKACVMEKAVAYLNSKSHYDSKHFNTNSACIFTPSTGVCVCLCKKRFNHTAFFNEFCDGLIRGEQSNKLGMVFI